MITRRLSAGGRLLGFGTAVLLLAATACGSTSAPPDRVSTAASADTSAEQEPLRTEAPAGQADQKSAAATNTQARYLVALDPGHGADEVGAAANGVVEKNSNLDMAFRVGRILGERGVDVLLTREGDNRAAVGGTGQSVTRTDLQARVHAANAAGAAVFISLHSNGSTNTTERGIEVYYDSRRELAEQNARLARLVLDGAVGGLAGIGEAPRNRGVLDAACWRSNNGRCVGLFVLSPGAASGPNQIVGKEATNMPAVLVELLFISNADDAALLCQDAARDALARGVANGILRYLGMGL
jgi:N-acetylmuramoyl-L-alanine amidase